MITTVIQIALTEIIFDRGSVRLGGAPTGLDKQNFPQEIGEDLDIINVAQHVNDLSS